MDARLWRWVRPAGYSPCQSRHPGFKLKFLFALLLSEQRAPWRTHDREHTRLVRMPWPHPLSLSNPNILLGPLTPLIPNPCPTISCLHSLSHTTVSTPAMVTAGWTSPDLCSLILCGIGVFSRTRFDICKPLSLLCPPLPGLPVH